MTAHELVEWVMRAILPGRYPTPEGCTEDLAVTKLLRHRIPLEKAAEAFLADTRDWESAAHRLFNLLMFLDSNARSARDAAAIKTYESLDWKGRWQDAVKAMLKAADLLDDPVRGSDGFGFGKLLDMPRDDPISLNTIAEPIPEDLGTVDSVVRYAELDLLALAVRRIANAMHEAGWENVMPLGARVHEHNWHGVSPELIGRRGGAADNEAATRGLLIKELDKRLPGDAKDRYALIADLAAIAGENVPRQLVRGILLNGRT